MDIRDVKSILEGTHRHQEVIEAYIKGETVEWTVADNLYEWRESNINDGGDLQFNELYEYRIKRHTVKINGFEVDAPVTAQTYKCTGRYYTPALTLFSRGYLHVDTRDRKFTKLLISRGLLFDSRERAEAAAAAMLGIDPADVVSYWDEVPDD